MIEKSEKIVQTMASPEELRSSWDNFTDPEHHDSSNFQYLTHSIQFRPRNHYIVNRAKELGRYRPEYDIDLTDKPLRVCEKQRIASAVINQKHTTTFTHGGLIISTPYDNIACTYAGDVGSMGSDVSTYRSRNHICTPEELLQHTKPFEWNEVVLEGSTSSGNVSVNGFFVKTFDDGSLIDVELGSKIIALAEQHNLPLVKIVDTTIPSPDENSRILYFDERPSSIIFVRNGLRFIIGLNDNVFQIATSHRLSYAMTRDEFNYAKEIIHNELPTDDPIVSDILKKLETRFDVFEESPDTDPYLRKVRPERLV